MIGIYPGTNKTFQVMGDFNEENKIEGRLYYHPETKRLYYYSTTETRSCPDNNYFPIYNGRRTFESSFSNVKYLSDATTMDMTALSKRITSDVARNVIYNQRKSENDELLKPSISDGDNMFTQCVKGVICAMNITMVDLIDMCDPKLPDKTVENYYSALTKITFMRLDKWKIWLSVILHVGYVLDVNDGKKKLITYKYPEDRFDTGIIKYDDILNQNISDPFKKIVKVLMVMKSITKSSLRSSSVDDYSINNLFTTINSNKPLSAQLFNRFIRLSNLFYTIRIYDADKQMLFEYTQEGGM